MSPVNPSPLLSPSAATLRRTQSTSAIPTASAIPNASEATATTSTITGNDTVQLPANPEKRASEATHQSNKLPEFLQSVVEFFENLYKKFMDLFTPTSKEALELALVKAQSRKEKYEDRISWQQAIESPETLGEDFQKAIKKLSPAEQKFYKQDAQKSKKKLKALNEKIQTLTTRYQKLTGTTAANTATTSRVANTEAATSKAAETLEGEDEDIFNQFFKQGSELFNQLKEESPELFAQIEKLLKSAVKP